MCDVFPSSSDKGRELWSAQKDRAGETRARSPGALCWVSGSHSNLPQHGPHHFHKLGLASGGFEVQRSQDIDKGCQGGAGQGRIPSSFGREVASCSYGPAKEMKATRSAKNSSWALEREADSFISSQTPQAIFYFVGSQIILSSERP